ncbi:glycosyltransferase family 2 protein [Prosthecomicrobium pneumaticum]|uniref:Glycosyltransferase involved in cell wall biosynthesis n=1 Tax=Prosthecomicrobium pneumaticum TaxID=81895 RepID=A0A7W9CTC4_9HYPH|nr:glycosyltransferase family A protein [Prosthecomicrobium pneumaticum]MBB5751264.1 glycosyltransferase involved in cell wall biosynthesis [Prosthecomicrobium pneumaticum]
MSVAVVVPVYNRPALVRRALASIAQQTHAAAQVIVVDDGSTDDTAASARAWLAEHAPFAWEVVTTPNGGPASARNAGARLVDPAHEFIAFLDSDDEWPEDFLAGCRAALAAHPEAVGAVANRQTIRDGAPYAYDHMASFAADPVLFVLEFGGGLVQCCVFRTRFYRLTGGFDSSWRTGEDGKMLIGLAMWGPFVHSQGSPVLVHQRSSHGEGGDAQSISLASARDFWIWADQMDRMIAALPREFRRQRYATICFIMAGRWTYTRRLLREGGLKTLGYRAKWRKTLWTWRSRRHARAS